MNAEPHRSSEQIQARLKSLRQAAGHAGTDGTGQEVEITVASQRDAFDLPACRALLMENGISSKLVGHGFQQVIVVARDDSGRAMDVIAAHRDRLIRRNPLGAGDYVVGIVAWALGCGLALPGLGLWFLMHFQAKASVVIVVVPVLLGCALLLGGFLGYLRCHLIASRRQK